MHYVFQYILMLSSCSIGRQPIADGGSIWSQDVLGMLFSPSEVLILVIITAVVVFLRTRDRRAK